MSACYSYILVDEAGNVHKNVQHYLTPNNGSRREIRNASTLQRTHPTVKHQPNATPRLSTDQ